MAETVQVAGLVTARSAYGIKINDGDWLNWTKEEYREKPFDKDGAQKGARVVCQVNDGKYIKTVEVLGDQSDESELPFNGEDKPLAQEGPPSHPPGVTADEYAQETALAEKMRNRETALNAAAWVGVSMAGDVEEKGGKILYIAGLFEDWLSRD